MSFFEKFGKSALELKSLKCLTGTGIMIAMCIVLKMFSIKITSDLKITFSFIALAVIGMLFGPTVSFLAGIITDIIGYMLSPDGGFSPLFTLVEAVGAMLYGIFLYEIKPIDLGNKEKGSLTGGVIVREILICLGVGAAAGLIIGYVFFAIWNGLAPMQEEDGLIGKIAAVFSSMTLVYAAGAIGFLYGAFFTFIIRSGRSHKGEFGKTLRVVLAKVTVVVVCNLIMTPAAMVISGYMTWDSMVAAYPLRVIKNAVQCPLDCIILLFVLFPVLSAYRRIFPESAAKKENTD